MNREKKPHNYLHILGCICNQKKCFFPLNINFPSNTKITITFGTLKNPNSVKDQTGINVSIAFDSSTVAPYQKIITISGYLAGSIRIENFTQSSFKRAAKNNYTVFFNIQNDIMQNGKIIFTFPNTNESSLTNVKNVFWKSYLSTTEKSVEFTTSSQILTLPKIFNETGLVVNSAGILMIRIDGAQNPSILINTTSIQMQTATIDGYIIDEVIFFRF